MNYLIYSRNVKRKHCEVSTTWMEFVNYLDGRCLYQVGHQLRVIAYRIDILFELGARVSELKQITFNMILSRKVSYIPQKQNRKAENARRTLFLTSEIDELTKGFIKLQQINDSQLTLNIGDQNKLVKYNTLQNALSKVKLLLLEQTKETTEYSEFLKCFSLHDLRHSKLLSLSVKGVAINQIQEFIKHSSLQTTEKYIKNIGTIPIGIDGEDINDDSQKQLKLRLRFNQDEKQ